MSVFNNFDASTVTPAGEFEPLPEGWYRVVIEEAVEKANSKGTGEFLECKLQVIQGEHKGRTVFHRITTRNQSQVAQTIGRGQLSALCHAVETMTPRSTAEIVNKPFMAKVVVRKYDKDGETRHSNDVKAVLSLNKHAAKYQQTQTAEGTPTTPAEDAPPWEAK